MSAEAKEEVPDVVQSVTASQSKLAATIKSAVATDGSKKKKKKKKKKGKPGKYSLLVIDAVKYLGEKNGSSLVKIYNEAKKVSWFDQQNGRMYLRSSIRALVLNDTLIQVKGLGANGSFKLNKKKFEKKAQSKSKTTKATKPSKTTKAAKPSKTTKATKPAKPAKRLPQKTGGRKTKATESARKKLLKKPTAAKKKSVVKKKASPKKTAAKKPQITPRRAVRARKSR